MQQIRWGRCFRHFHFRHEEELQPEPAVPGVVGAEEDLGGAGEWWECYKVLTQTWPLASPPPIFRS